MSCCGALELASTSPCPFQRQLECNAEEQAELAIAHGPALASGLVATHVARPPAGGPCNQAATPAIVTRRPSLAEASPLGGVPESSAWTLMCAGPIQSDWDKLRAIELVRLLSRARVLGLGQPSGFLRQDWVWSLRGWRALVVQRVGWPGPACLCIAVA
eukprot:365600-Chlamydomonas_euryale.AAC.12